MIKKMTIWLRSKFMTGYSQPTETEIETFLCSSFKNPDPNKKEKIHYIKPYELHALIDDHFHFKTDKKINIRVFRKLNYSLIKRRDFVKKAQYDAVPLVILNPTIWKNTSN